MDFETAVALRAATVPLDATLIRTSGFFVVGDGGAGTYVRSATEPAYPAFSLLSADGAFWRYIRDARGVNAKAFGARGDATLERAFALQGGTDDAPAIQNAIDFAVYGGHDPVYLPAGVYRIADTIHLGYGAGGFEGASLEGDGPSYRGQMGGTAIYAAFSDRPALAVQGARMTRIRRLSLIGLNGGWIMARKLMRPDRAADDTQIEAWVDPQLHPNAASRYAPYAGVAIDPYAGAAPTPAYPPVRYPPMLGPTPQYGKAFSSDVLIEDCYLGGFVVGVAIHPCDASGNGDFIRLRNSIVELCAYVISAGDSQGREVSALQCGMTLFHTGVANTAHGRQQGQLDFTSEMTSWESGIQILGIGSAAYAGPFNFRGGYSESLWRIGDWGAGPAQMAAPLVFDSHSFSFTSQMAPERGTPATVLSAPSGQATLRGCMLKNFADVLMFGGDPALYAIEDCGVFAGSRAGTLARARPLAADKAAHDVLAGGVCFTPVAPAAWPARFGVATGLFKLDTGALVSSASVGETAEARPGIPICAWSRQATVGAQVLACPPRWRRFDKARLSGAAFKAADGRLTATFPKLAGDAGLAPGDLLVDAASATLFRVRAVSGTAPATVTADIWNNCRRAADVWETLVPFDPAAGALWHLSSRLGLEDAPAGQRPAGGPAGFLVRPPLPNEA